MGKISTSMVKVVLEQMYDLRSELVPCFIGDPGIGKTQGVYEFAKEKGVNVVTFILSNTVPSEVSGIRMPDKESKKMEVFDDLRMASLEDGDILFLDEILEAPPQLWSACLTLIQDRIMASGRKLPDVFIVAASNPVVSPSIIPASTRDRFMFIELSFDFDTWCSWFKRTRHVKPPTDLRYHFARNIDGTYNIMTPRKFTKLFDWYKLGLSVTKETVVTSMFDHNIHRILENMVDMKPDAHDQIAKCIESLMDIPDNWDSMSLSEIMELLKSRPNWDDIEQALSTTVFDQ